MTIELGEVTIAQLQNEMAAGACTAASLTEGYLAAIDAVDDALCAVIETNPDAPAIAAQLDREREDGHVRGPLHGIPILLKDNIDTADRMQTTAGSLALLGSRPARDATVAAALREAGAIILGKANLSEWANFRSNGSTSGWSARGGQCCNPYDLSRNPGGSSSGSGAAVSANLASAALGTETDGSIVNPAGACGIVGIKPTVGLSSRAGVIPISHTQDTVGPMARTVADAAAVLGALTMADGRDAATAANQRKVHSDYRAFLDADGLRGARIGVARKGVSGYDAATDRIFEEAIRAIGDAGAEVIDPADIPTVDGGRLGASEMVIMQTEFKHGIAAYLATRMVVDAELPQPRSLADLVRFNKEHAEQELIHFGQERFEQGAGERPARWGGLFAGAGYGKAAGRDGGAGRSAGRVRSGRARCADGRTGLAARPAGGGYFSWRQFPLRGGGRLSAGDAASRLCVTRGRNGREIRPSGRSHIYGPRLERTGADPPGLRL